MRADKLDGLLRLELDVSTDTEPGLWLNVFGESVAFDVVRGGKPAGVTDDQDAGQLTVTIRSAALDPAQADTIRRGQVVRLVAGTDRLFTGRVTYADVTYPGRKRDPQVRPTIVVTAVDVIERMRNDPRPYNYAGTLGAKVRALLAGTSYPYITDAGAASTEILSMREGAKLWDQLILARDSHVAAVWVNKDGTLHATANPGSRPLWQLNPLDPLASFTDLATSYSARALVNSLTITRDNRREADPPHTYGPYLNQESIDRYGEVTDDLDVIDGNPSVLALAYLARTGDPQLVPEVVTLDPAKTPAASQIDLYDRIKIANSSGIDPAAEWIVVGIEHHADSGAGWMTKLILRAPITSKPVTISYPPAGPDTGPVEQLPTPPRASEPILTSRLGAVTIAWNGKDHLGRPAPVANRGVEVWRTDPDDPDTIVGTIGIAGGLVVDADLAYGVQYTYRLRLIDRDGRPAALSDPGFITVQPIVDTDLIGKIIYGDNVVDGAISTDQLAAGAVTTNKLRIGVAGNMVADPGFRNPAINATRFDQNCIVNADGSVHVTDPNGVRLWLLGDKLGSTSSVPPTSGWAPVQPGDKIRLSYMVRSAIARPARWQINWIDYAGNAFGGEYPVVTNLAAGVDTEMAAVITAPAGAVGLVAAPTFDGGQPAGAVVVWRPRVWLQTPSVLIQDGAVTAVKIAALAVTAGKIAANAITADKIDAGAITASKLSADAIDGKTINGVEIITDRSFRVGSLTGNFLSYNSAFDQLVMNGTFQTNSDTASGGFIRISNDWAEDDTFMGIEFSRPSVDRTASIMSNRGGWADPAGAIWTAGTLFMRSANVSGGHTWLALDNSFFELAAYAQSNAVLKQCVSGDYTAGVGGVTYLASLSGNGNNEITLRSDGQPGVWLFAAGGRYVFADLPASSNTSFVDVIAPGGTGSLRGQLYLRSSLSRYKLDQQPIGAEYGLLELAGKTWIDKAEAEAVPGWSKRSAGFVAEDVLALSDQYGGRFDPLLSYGADGVLQGVGYVAFIPYLLRIIADQDRRLAALEGRPPAAARAARAAGVGRDPAKPDPRYVKPEPELPADRRQPVRPTPPTPETT